MSIPEHSSRQWGSSLLVLRALCLGEQIQVQEVQLGPETSGLGSTLLLCDLQRYARLLWATSSQLQKLQTLLVETLMLVTGASWAVGRSGSYTPTPLRGDRTEDTWDLQPSRCGPDPSLRSCVAPGGDPTPLSLTTCKVERTGATLQYCHNNVEIEHLAWVLAQSPQQAQSCLGSAHVSEEPTS